VSKSKYLHGYTSEEQARLEDQARLLEPYVYEGVEFKRDTSLLEVGCGIGAQSKILLKRFSSIKKLVGIDISEDQLRVARETLAQELLDNRLELHQSDARDLAILKGRTFDGAFLCWFLEHVPALLFVIVSELPITLAYYINIFTIKFTHITSSICLFTGDKSRA
jgi:SAM-dependent methyltransferase